MARILFVWEVGKGFGHLGPYLPLVTTLKQKGHEVIFAARDVGNAEEIFGTYGVPVLQAPVMMHKVTNPYRNQYSFVHLLHNNGFADRTSLLGLVKAWRHLYDQVHPDLVVFDYSPTAMLAAKGYKWKKIVSGSGFLIPPATAPLPLMRYWQKYNHERLLNDEGRLVGNMNHVLAKLDLPTLQTVSELYDTDEIFLLGFEEMDHYPQRGGGNYLGMFSITGHGVSPQWPVDADRRIFAYLHPYKKLKPLLELLANRRLASLVYAPEIPAAGKKRYSRKNLAFIDEPVDITRAAAECDVAVTNATFGTTAAFLLCGRPVLCIPTNLERLMVARRVMDMGAGLAVPQNVPEKLKPALSKLLTSDQFAVSAGRFRDKYKHLDLNWQTDQMLNIVQGLV